MGSWSHVTDASWQKVEQVFSIQKTPPLKYIALQTPNAPKKASVQIYRRNLKPRKLIYEMEDTKRQEEKPNKTWEESDAILWAASSSTLKAEDANKENRPESGNRHKSKGIVCDKSDDRICDRGRKGTVRESDFRPIRI